MKIEVFDEFNDKFPNEKEIKRIIREINREIKLEEEERFPKNISFIPQMTILPYGRYNKQEDKLEIFMPRLFLSKSYWNKKKWRIVIKHILTHELIEPIERKTISSSLKAWLNRQYYTLVPITFSSLNLRGDDLSLEAFSEDTCGDIITDRRCLYSEEQELGFSLIHKEILEVEKHILKDFKIKKINDIYYTNKEPYELMCWLLSGMRKNIINIHVKKYKLGRFQSHILLNTIGKKVKYPELQQNLYLIIKELKKKNPSYKLVYKYSKNFVNKLKYNKDL